MLFCAKFRKAPLQPVYCDWKIWGMGWENGVRQRHICTSPWRSKIKQYSNNQRRPRTHSKNHTDENMYTHSSSIQRINTIVLRGATSHSKIQTKEPDIYGYRRHTAVTEINAMRNGTSHMQAYQSSIPRQQYVTQWCNDIGIVSDRMDFQAGFDLWHLVSRGRKVRSASESQRHLQRSDSCFYATYRAFINCFSSSSSSGGILQCAKGSRFFQPGLNASCKSNPAFKPFHYELNSLVFRGPGFWSRGCKL